MTETTRPETAFVFCRAPSWLPRSHMSKHAPLTERMEVEVLSGVCEKKQEEEASPFHPAPSWWIVRSVWLRARMNKHALGGVSCRHSECKPLDCVTRWDFKKWLKCKLITAAARRRFTYSWIVLMLSRLYCRTTALSSPAVNNNTTIENAVFLFLKPIFYCHPCVLHLNTELIWNV